MKKIFLLFILCPLMQGLKAQNSERNSMILWKSQIDSTGVLIEENASLSFDGDRMTYRTANGSVVLPFSLTEWKWISFSIGSPTVGIRLMTNDVAAARTAHFSGSSLVLKGFGGETLQVSIYDLSGKLVFKRSGVHGSPIDGITGVEAPNSYIVKVNQYVFKVSKS